MAGTTAITNQNISVAPTRQRLTCNQILDISARVVVAVLAFFIFLATLTIWTGARDFALKQFKKCHDICSPGKNDLKNLIEGRENRIILDASLITEKLKKEFTAAQNQMNSQVDNSNFVYKERDAQGQVEATRVGNYDVGICHFIGKRDSMEDEHIAAEFTLRLDGKEYPVQLFGIFDGHAGKEASQFVKKHLKDTLRNTLLDFNAKGLSEIGTWNALKQTFVRLNHKFKEIDSSSGSTATVALIFNNELWTANVGDSRTALANGRNSVQLSEDAKPSDKKYEKSIIKRDGYVAFNRVCAQLGVARAIGDFNVRGVSARPKITCVKLADIQPNSHLVLACDGIYDVASTKQVVSAINEHRSERAESLAKNIVGSAYAAGSEDNLSALVVKLK